MPGGRVRVIGSTKGPAPTAVPDEDHAGVAPAVTSPHLLEMALLRPHGFPTWRPHGDWVDLPPNGVSVGMLKYHLGCNQQALTLFS